MKTIKFIDQIAASHEIYAAALNNIEDLSYSELRLALSPAPTPWTAYCPSPAPTPWTAYYEASTGRVAPDFYASNTAAVEDIRRCASLGTAP